MSDGLDMDAIHMRRSGVTADGHKRPRSATGQVRAWFEANAGEFLSYDDIATRFGVQRKKAMQIIERLKLEGLVRSEVLVFTDPDRPRL